MDARVGRIRTDPVGSGWLERVRVSTHTATTVLTRSTRLSLSLIWRRAGGRSLCVSRTRRGHGCRGHGHCAGRRSPLATCTASGCCTPLSVPRGGTCSPPHTSHAPSQCGPPAGAPSGNYVQRASRQLSSSPVSQTRASSDPDVIRLGRHRTRTQKTSDLMTCCTGAPGSSWRSYGRPLEGPQMEERLPGPVTDHVHRYLEANGMVISSSD